MITGTKENLDKIARDYVCAEHGTPVTVAWHAKENSYVLRCGKGEYPEEVTREPSPTMLAKQGKIEPAGKWFNLLPKVDLETGEVLSRETITALVAYANMYGLDAYRGHVMVMHGAPYIGIDGYLYHANKKNIPYSLTGRPLNEDELKIHGYEAGDLGWYSKVQMHDTNQIFEGYGFVKKSELTSRSKKNPDRLRYPVVADKPGVMVIKRADWQALRRAFPIGTAEEENVEAGD